MSNILPSTTASDIISFVRSRCRLGTAPPNAAFQETQMLVALNDINEWFYFWPLDYGNMAPWKFTRDQQIFLAKNLTTLANAATAGDATLDLTSGSDFDSPSSDVAAAYLRDTNWIYGFFTYEGRTTNQLTGVDTIQIDYAAGTEVRKIYKLRENYGRPRTLMVNGTAYKFLDSEFDDVPPAGCFFTKYLKSVNGFDSFFAVLPPLVGAGVTCKMHYVKAPTKILAPTTKIDAVDGIARWAVIKKFEEFCWTHRGESALASEAASAAQDYIEQYAATQSGEDASPDQGPIFDLD